MAQNLFLGPTDVGTRIHMGPFGGFTMTPGHVTDFMYVGGCCV